MSERANSVFLGSFPNTYANTMLKTDLKLALSIMNLTKTKPSEQFVA